MKKLFTLFMVLGAAVAFGQYNPKSIQHPTYVDRKFFNPPVNTTRAAGSACDSFDMVDYCTFNEVISLQQGQASNAYYGFNTNANPLYIQELTSFVTNASGNAGYNTYVGAAFDTLAFQDYSSQVTYGYPMATSTVTLEGIQFFYVFDADTLTADHKLDNDSLVFTVYPINNAAGVGTTDTTTVLFKGVVTGDSLKPYFTGQNIGIGAIPANAALAQGQGFFIKVQYLNKDTSTHFDMCFTFLDSCGLVSYMGGNYLLADLSPLTSNVTYLGNVGLSFMGVIFPGTGTGPATVQDWNNLYGIQSGVPRNCSLVPNQNWAILPLIDVCQPYSAQAHASPSSACPGGTISLTGTVTGSATATTIVTPNTLTISSQPITNKLHIGDANTAGLTYSWTASSGTLTGSTSATPTLSMPGSGNVTVSLDINDGAADATASVVVTSNPINLTITNSPQPVPLACAGNVTLNTSVTGSTTGHNYHWHAVGLDSTGAGVSKIKVTTPGTYFVTVTNGAGCTSNDSVVVVYSNGATNIVSFTDSPATICQGTNETFTNTSSNTVGWTASWSFGDGGTSDSLFSTTYKFNTSGTWPVTLTMDSAGCVFSSPAHGYTVYPSLSTHCTVGISNVTFDEAISVVPNPSNGNINIAINGVQSNVSIRVYNILGAEVAGYAATDVASVFSKSFDFSGFASGTYLIKVQSADKIAIKRLIITK